MTGSSVPPDRRPVKRVGRVHSPIRCVVFSLIRQSGSSLATRCGARPHRSMAMSGVRHSGCLEEHSGFSQHGTTSPASAACGGRPLTPHSESTVSGLRGGLNGSSGVFGLALDPGSFPPVLGWARVSARRRSVTRSASQPCNRRPHRTDHLESGARSRSNRAANTAVTILHADSLQDQGITAPWSGRPRAGSPEARQILAPIPGVGAQAGAFRGPAQACPVAAHRPTVRRQPASQDQETHRS